ncbi:MULTISPECIES: putative DNA-binding domain-containing protein [unclassified Sinorhizobium]|uniref:HvfC/BufC family peptide modification chaperone n=1 Tax=unclassified Sinorhizobium TaxID=2613772 RepID=UPI003524E3A1
MSITTQMQFAATLRDTNQPVPEGLNAWNGARPERRFGVYRNNVAVGLIGAIASRFPVAERIVGKDFFAAMAHEFIRLNPPRSPLLLAYGDDFAEFAESFEPAKEINYLPDVIRLEAARGRAYHAADAVPLDTARLAAVDPQHVASLRFTMHPSAAIVRSVHPIITIWAMNAGEMMLSPIQEWQCEDALVVRPEMTVLVRRLPAGCAAFLQALTSGAELSAAVEAAVVDSAEFDLSANLAGALQAGAFAAICRA